MTKIPILLYHSLCSSTDMNADRSSVTFEDFKQQMEYLHHNGFVAVSLEKIFAEHEYWKTDETRTDGPPRDIRKKVVLTFDDGDASNFYYAMPTLKEIGFSATFFVTINEIGKPGRMDWSMIYDLSRQGMGIGSHGLSHHFLTAHTNYTVLNELILSKQILEKYTRKRVDFLSVPQGFYNKRILTIARDVGFKAACVSDAGLNDFTAQDQFLLKRTAMRRRYDLKTFKSIACGRPCLAVTAAEGVNKTLRNVLGPEVYGRFKKLRNQEKKIEERL